MKIDNMLMDMPVNISNATMVKAMVLDRLLMDKVITQSEHREYSDEWQVIVIKRSWYKRWWNRFHKGTDDSYIYKLVKF